MTQASPWLAAWLFVALLATAIALGPALAHLFEMPNKLPLDTQDYHTTQQIYRGWAWIAVILGVELVAISAVAITGRSDAVVLTAAVVALAALLSSQAIFWLWTAPANAATDQWNAIPENYDALRRQWEYSHAAGALLQLLVMASLSLAAVSVIWRGTSG